MIVMGVEDGWVGREGVAVVVGGSGVGLSVGVADGAVVVEAVVLAVSVEVGVLTSSVVEGASEGMAGELASSVVLVSLGTELLSGAWGSGTSADTETTAEDVVTPLGVIVSSLKRSQELRSRAQLSSAAP